MKTVATTLTLLALAGLAGACSDAGDDPVTNNEATAAVVQNVAVPVPSDGVVNVLEPDVKDSPAAMNAADMADEDDTLAAFPATFQGRWGMTAADCDATRSDAKGLLTIGADNVKFYESVGRPVEMTMSGGKLKADLSFIGEGQSWKSRSVFELIGSGKKLVRTEESPAGSFAYTKCTS